MIEKLWMYTGFTFWIAVIWLVISFMIWLGGQMLWAIWKKYGSYRKIRSLLDFLDENEKCKDKFYEWQWRRRDNE